MNTIHPTSFLLSGYKVKTCIHNAQRENRVHNRSKMNNIIEVVLFITMLYLFAGCKPNQLITEKVTTKTDSTVLWNLQDNLYKKEVQITNLQADLQRTRDENIRLTNEISKHEIYYDTTAPVNPETGRPPVASETIATSKSTLEETKKEYETLLKEASIENQNLTQQNANLQLTIQNLANENKELKDKTTTSTSFKFKLFFTGLITGILLSLAAYFSLRKPIN